MEDDDSFILIGGWQGFHVPEGSHFSVTRYDMDGFIEHLPELRKERDGSGCSYFYSGYGKVILVVHCYYPFPCNQTNHKSLLSINLGKKGENL